MTNLPCGEFRIWGGFIWQDVTKHFIMGGEVQILECLADSELHFASVPLWNVSGPNEFCAWGAPKWRECHKTLHSENYGKWSPVFRFLNSVCQAPDSLTHQSLNPTFSGSLSGQCTSVWHVPAHSDVEAGTPTSGKTKVRLKSYRGCLNFLSFFFLNSVRSKKSFLF